MSRRRVWLGAAGLVLVAGAAGIGSVAAGGLGQTDLAWLAGPALARARP